MSFVDYISRLSIRGRLLVVLFLWYVIFVVYLKDEFFGDNLLIIGLVLWYLYSRDTEKGDKKRSVRVKWASYFVLMLITLWDNYFGTVPSISLVLGLTVAVASIEGIDNYYEWLKLSGYIE
jgi:hypothetical protein